MLKKGKIAENMPVQRTYALYICVYIVVLQLYILYCASNGGCLHHKPLGLFYHIPFICMYVLLFFDPFLYQPSYQ